jgi:hypothetical protein
MLPILPSRSPRRSDTDIGTLQAKDQPQQRHEHQVDEGKNHRRIVPNPCCGGDSNA